MWHPISQYLPFLPTFLPMPPLTSMFNWIASVVVQITCFKPGNEVRNTLQSPMTGGTIYI